MLLVRPSVGALLDPLPPVLLRRAEQRARLLDIAKGAHTRALAGHGQAEGYGLAGHHRELLGGTAQRDGPGDAPVVLQGVAVEALVFSFHGVFQAAVVRSRLDAHPHPALARKAGDHAHDPRMAMGASMLFHVVGIERHEIDDLGQAILGLEDGA